MSAMKDVDIFISYTRHDAATVVQITGVLRRAGLRVWMDAAIPMGDEWRRAITDALARSRLVLLVHSLRAEQSVEVAKEIAVASSMKLPIVPLRIEDVAPKGALLYEMARLSWVDCFPHTEARMLTIAIALADLVKAEGDPGARRRFELSVDARRFGASLWRRLVDAPWALAVAMVFVTAGLMAQYDHITGFLAQQADAGLAPLESLGMLGVVASLGSPMLLLGALSRLTQPGVAPLAALAAVNVLLLMGLLRCTLRWVRLRWSVRRAGGRSAVPS